MDLDLSKYDFGEDQEIQVKEALKKCMDAVKTATGNLETMNIIVMGKSGVGKSTLINNIFRGDFARTGKGRPVTDRITRITKDNFPMVIYDTPGFELSEKQRDEVKEGVFEIVEKGKETGEPIHCIWYCVGVPGGRFEKEEGEWLLNLQKNELTRDIPIIMVLTQSYDLKDAKDMMNAVKKFGPKRTEIVRVLAEDKVIGENTYKAYGLDILVDVMAASKIPSNVQNTLQNMQKVNLASKKKRAQAIVAANVTAAFGAGFTPLPFSDWMALVPIQFTMIAEITAVFGVKVSKGLMSTFISASLGSGGASIAGRAVVSNILKAIPVAGTLVGGVVSGGVAGAMTTALGQAYIKVMELIYSGERKESDFSGKEGKEEIKELFMDLLKHRKR